MVEDLSTRELAERAFAGGKGLLEQEDPNTTHAVDARRWITVYGQLVEFKDDLISRANGKFSKLGPEAMAEVNNSDLHAIQAQRERYMARLSFWQTRHLELQGLELDKESLLVSHGLRNEALTRREFELLSFFLSHPDHTFSSPQLASRAWGDHRLASEEVRTYISRLRKKLDTLDAPCRIVNQPRRGYYLSYAAPVRVHVLEGAAS